MSYIYTFVREDISPEQKIVQIGHACYEAGKIFQDNCGISNLILLSVQDESELKNVARNLDRRGIEFHAFYEPDNQMGYSAICTQPILDERERSFFRKWNLYKHTY
jgi:hypothetical protein